MLQKCGQVNEMFSYAFLHSTAVTHYSYINSIGKCTSFFLLGKIYQVFVDKKKKKKERNSFIATRTCKITRVGYVPFNNFMTLKSCCPNVC